MNDGKNGEQLGSEDPKSKPPRSEDPEGIKAWLDYLDKYRKISKNIKDLTENQEQNLAEIDVDSFIEHDREKEKLLSRLDMLKNKIFSCKEKFQDALTEEQLNKIRTIQKEINENITIALERSKNQEKKLDLLQGDEKKKYQELNNKQSLKKLYSKKKNREEGVNKNIGSRFDKKN